MEELKLSAKCRQVIELYDRVLRKPLAQIISQDLRQARIPCIGKGQCQAVIHIPPRRTSLRENGLLPCYICVSEQRFPQGRRSIVGCSPFFLPCSPRGIC